ncbi:substrate-binding domain-containing protein [Nonomuraea aurantiaca]|uniref:substrate-binding domain-containing protein n=1 Tax=Nonomuraea aurantiaca TaxID=2878562 RepID=UPI003558B947
MTERRTGIIRAALFVALTLAASAVGLTGTAMLTRDETPRNLPITASITASISGSGSSAQKGAMDAWRADFHGLHPDLRVDYNANGSGAGIRDFVTGVTAFAGSDVAMRPGEQLLADRRCRSRAVHLPMVVGPIALPTTPAPPTTSPPISRRRAAGRTSRPGSSPSPGRA